MDYKKAGVDIEAGYKSVELMKEHIAKTMRPEVLTNIGGFSGAFSMGKFKDMEKPTLVSGTDGVGTKLKLAFLMDQHDTVGIDCVAMCVNDIACAGGEPLFFLDYIACGKNYPEKIAQIVKGVATGCEQSDAALIGGETAEMPGFYPEDEYDLAGFCVGMVDSEKVIDGSSMEEGDAIIGIQSSGVHSNGFSLVTIVFDVNEENLPYRKVDEKTDIEEERRLMYVAITRAKDQVIILYNNKNASQFVSQSQLAKADFKVGDMILHKAFGKGRIVNTDSKYIQIEFPEKNRTMKINFEYAITKNIIKKL